MSDNFWYIFFASASGTAIVTFLLKLIDKLIDARLSSANTEKDTKNRLADEIIKICSEGASGHHTFPPRSEEHIKNIAYQARRFDMQIYEDLLAYLRNWSEHSTELDDESKVWRRTYRECNKYHSRLLDNSEKLKK